MGPTEIDHRPRRTGRAVGSTVGAAKAAVREVMAALDEPQAFRDFYEQTLPRVYGYFLHRCGGSVAVAEGLTQETYLAAVREVRRRRSVDAPIPWLFGIARHKLIDHYRRQGRAQDLIVPWYDGIEEDAILPSLDLRCEEVRDHVVEALARLPASQRAVLVLRYADGLSVPDVANAVSKSVHAVESLLARGRTALKRLLMELGHD